MEPTTINAMLPTYSELEVRVKNLELEILQVRDEIKRFQNFSENDNNGDAEQVSSRESNSQSPGYHLKSILDNMPAMIGYWDINLRNRFGNKAYSTWLGIEPKKMLGMHIRDVLGEDRYMLNLPYIESALRGEPQKFERDIPSPDGKFVRHSLAEYVPDIFNNEVRGIFVQVSDITKIKEAEAISKLLEVSLNQVRDAFYLSSESGHLYYVNNAACLSLGYERVELIGIHVSDINPDFSREEWPENWKLLKSKGSLTFEGRYKRKDGSFFPVDINTNYFEYQGISFSLSVVRDITENERVKNTWELQSSILLNIHEGVQITRVSDETIVYTTPVFNRMFGYLENELVGKKVSNLNAHTTKPAEQVSSDINEILNESGYWQGEILNARKDGSSIWCWVKISSFDHHEFGKVWVAVHEDINQRKQAELEIQQLKESVNRDLLVREVHHRIKNNLQGITGVLRRHSEIHPELAAPLNGAISQVQSVAIIHGLQGRTGESKVRLCELTTAISVGMESLWNKKIPVDIPPDWSHCNIIESETVPIALILNELIANALKHGGPDGDVSIKLRHKQNDNSVTISICNPGYIPPEFGLNNPVQFGTGLQLVSSLMPQTGARLYWEQDQQKVLTQFELDIPIIHLDSSLYVDVER